MTKHFLKLLLAAAIGLGAQGALAQGMGMGAPSFAAMDSDSNGELSAEEIAALPFVQGGQVSADQVAGL